MNKNWKEQFREVLPLLGHRNWILVVDKAYPLQSAEGMTVLNSGEPMQDALGEVLKEVAAAPHIRPIVYTDAELDVLEESFCKGITGVRRQIYSAIEHYGIKDHQTILHDKVFAKLDAASKLFQVVVVKTESLLPYTSVFIELDCGYWAASQEKQLRDKMAQLPQDDDSRKPWP